MHISFASDNLKKLCQEQKEMNKVLGAPCARKLRTRLSDLMAANRLSDLAAGRPHPLKGERLGQFALDLQGGIRLVFEAADEPIPTTQDGAIAWTQVTSVRIVYVGDYHD
jgi:proteic killer suppression protein